jgi:hypothetical protein
VPEVRVIEPAHFWIPPRLGSYGDEAVDLAELAGRTLDDEQKLAVDAMLSYGPGGRYAALESAILESRQNGKSAAVLLPVVLFDLFLRDDNPDRIVWTAHRFRTARDSFDDFCGCIAATPELSRRVKHISYSHGEEAIELHPDRKKPGSPAAKLEFLARSEGGGRGLGGKRVVLDEALILGATAMGSLMPTLSARDDPQINYGSSGAKQNSDHLHSLIKRGRSLKDPSLVWIEWCAPGSWAEPPCSQGSDCTHWPDTEGCALDDVEMWRKANHTLGKRITIAYVRGERRALPILEFGRERLGWHEESQLASGVLSMALWMTRMDVESEADGRVGIGVDASPDLASAAIGMTGIRTDGKRHWQVLRHDAGTSWVVGHLEQLRDVDKLDFGPIAIDPSSPAGALIKDITAAKFEVEEVTGRQLVQAWGSFKKEVDDDNGRHMGQDTLDQAIKDARNAPSGDVEKFSRKKSSGDITPLVSVTLSDHALRMSPAAPTPMFGWA